jgi:hypothetical protein
VRSSPSAGRSSLSSISSFFHLENAQRRDHRRNHWASRYLFSCTSQTVTKLSVIVFFHRPVGRPKLVKVSFSCMFLVIGLL